MKPKYLFQLSYLTPAQKDGNQHEVEEFIVMEDWDQARAYWARELNEPAHEILLMRRSVPVVAVGVSAIATRYGITQS